MNIGTMLPITKALSGNKASEAEVSFAPSGTETCQPKKGFLASRTETWFVYKRPLTAMVTLLCLAALHIYGKHQRKC